ncbi:hypothetical protein [uncultured Allomuricauda sp.]|uniref:hypothetical protein n=1 Tax=Flagellimonas sp. W118 TaxID=3410791 RepID=UPI0026083CAE|nr:hypothetical protein [uncultured Allomuricauda sp.]
MKKNLLLAILLIFLMVMNTVLLFLLLKEPEKRKGPPSTFISSQLGFDPGQQSEFMEIDRIHHFKMREISDRFRNLKEQLFTGMDDADFTEEKADSISNLIGELSAAKEKEIFSYFRQIENICNKDQKLKLESIVKRALRGGPGPGPGHGPPGPPPH